MNDDPVRWKDASDAPAGLRDVLRVANAIDPMSADVRAAMLAALPSGPPPVATSVGAGSAKTAIAVGSMIAGAVVVAAVWIGTRPAPHAAPAPMPAVERSAAPTVEPSAVPAVEPSAVPSVEEVVPSAAVTARPPRPAKGAFRAEPSGNLAEESALVGRARATLPSNPAGAMAIVDEHASRYPRGELASEREYLRIRALQALHRYSEARTRARAYLASYPMSPQAPAVREFLSGTKEDGR